MYFINFISKSLNMKLLFLILGINFTITTFAQNKKEQLETLTYRIDSLSLVIGKMNNDLVDKKLIIESKQKSIDSLGLLLSSEKKTIVNLKLKIEEQNTLLVYREKMMKYYQQKVDSLSEILSQKYYLDNLPKGYKMTDSNGQYGPECKSDFDSDGKEDLAIILFDEENVGRVFIYLSSVFYPIGYYQSFEWIFTGNLLDNFKCQNSSFQVSGGSESQGVYQDIILNYSSSEKKMVLGSYEDNVGRNGIQIQYVKQ